MDYREKILALARISPILPTTVAKELQTTTLMASAFLSEMVGKGLLAISNLKIGSSPLYYLSSAKHQLLGYIKYLNEKDQKTIQLLKEKKVLQNCSLDPLTRVSLAQIKDFSQPLEVTCGERKELFWKWFLTSDEEAKGLIQTTLEQAQQAKTKQAKPEQQTKLALPKPEQPGLEQQKPVEGQKRKAEEKPEEKKPARQARQTADFLQKIYSWFEKNKIMVAETTPIKKNAEYDFTIELDSALGRLAYHCTATAKKRVNENDLSSAFVRGQFKKLPVVLLMEGKLSGSAEKILENFKGLMVKKL